MAGSSQDLELTADEIYDIAVFKIYVYLSLVKKRILKAHHHRTVCKIGYLRSSSHMIMMVMSKDHSLDAKPFVLGISDKFQRLIARIYYVAVLSFSCADDIPVAFQTAAYKSLYFQLNSSFLAGIKIA